MITDIILIVAIVLWTLRLALLGAVSAEHAALVMIGLVILLPLLRKFRSAFLTIAGVAVFVVWHGGGRPDDMVAIAGAFFALVLALFGIYLMFRPFRGRKRADRTERNG